MSWYSSNSSCLDLPGPVFDIHHTSRKLTISKARRTVFDEEETFDLPYHSMIHEHFKLIFICNILCKYTDGAEAAKFGTFHLLNRAYFLGSVYKNLAFCGIIDAISSLIMLHISTCKLIRGRLSSNIS